MSVCVGVGIAACCSREALDGGLVCGCPVCGKLVGLGEGAEEEGVLGHVALREGGRGGHDDMGGPTTIIMTTGSGCAYSYQTALTTLCTPHAGHLEGRGAESAAAQPPHERVVQGTYPQRLVPRPQPLRQWRI